MQTLKDAAEEASADDEADATPGRGIANRPQKSNRPQKGTSLASAVTAAVAGPRDAIAIRPKYATLFITAGTLSGAIGAVVDRQVRAGKADRGCIRLLAIDADDKPIGLAHDRFLQLVHPTKGTSGFGTNPTAGGLEAVDRAQREIEAAVTAKWVELLEDAAPPHPRVPAAQVTRVVVIAGCGGVSGSVGYRLADWIIPLAERLGVANTLVDWVLLAPEMSIKAVNRTVEPRANEFILSNFSQTMRRHLARYAESRSVAGMSDAQAADALLLFGQKNYAGEATTTIADFVELVGRTVAMRFLTAAGSHAEARHIDSFGIGSVLGRIESADR